jgi:hypothetical protein
MEKRTWAYLQPPKAFEMAPCACGNHDTQWSEFAKHLWCAKCEIDFLPEHAGIFDGPIPSQLAHMMGIRFDRVQLESGLIERWDHVNTKYRMDDEDSALAAAAAA